VHAELDTSTYPTGVTVGDRQTNALPLDRHTWHGDWNYTLRPEPYAEINEAPDPFDQPSPDLAWLRHPTFTGLTATEWNGLTAQLLALHDTQREGQLEKRRGHRPRIKGDGTTGRRPVLTLTDRLLAVLLHQRLGLPQVAVARLFGVTPETVNRRSRDIRQLLQAADRIIEPAEPQLANLDALFELASSQGITLPAEIKTAS
ncbi:transposase family protein, partial [Kitasatospora sp. NPDC048343]|uniref:ISAzo13-like element transposase-related protein n=1 Tax=Kitasatospora sp. NPDC048343 TaxID=3154717 RepID=UPI0033DC8E47